MASSLMAFQVNCNVQRPSVLYDFSQFKSKISSVFKPFMKELQQLTIQLNVQKHIKNSSEKLLEAFVDSTFEFIQDPYLSSQVNFAPVDELGKPLVIVNIQGKIPDDFPTGVYIRNGINHLFGGSISTKSIFGLSSQPWVDGEGMLHAMYFDRSDKGDWTVVYNNKYLETETFLLEKQRNRPCFLPAAEGDSAAILAGILLNQLRFGKVNKDMSNTSVMEHGGKYYSFAEHHTPQEIDIFSLAILRYWDLDGQWKTPFGSHAKKAPGTGELVFNGVDVNKPHALVGVISADGEKLIHKLDLELSRCPLSHENGVTERYSVFIDFPLTIDLNRLLRGGPLLKYNKDEYARIGVFPRYGDVNSIRWFNVKPCCMFHLFNCFEDNDEVVVRGCRALESIVPGPERGLNKLEWFSKGLILKNKENEDTTSEDDHGTLFARCYEWRLNMRTGQVTEKYLTGTDYALDFSFINTDFTGLKNKYGYAQVADSYASAAAAVPKYNGVAKLYFEEVETEYPLREGESERQVKVEYHIFEEHTFGTGAVFVPKEQCEEEDDGWIVSYVHNEHTNVSQVHIIDAKNFCDDPVAKITLPCRVPHGFHGAFMQLPNVLSKLVMYGGLQDST
ncbi:hypothetical protein ACFE04_016348 [Oxalis oulophora]